MNLSKGSRLGPYEIDARLGAGGMGEVYKARDTRLARTVAIKILPREFADDAKLKVRFEREARAISSLTDPHICALYDVGSENGLEYLVMEYCDGVSLADRLAGGRLDLEQALLYGSQIAGALEKAHASGVIHRDIKPGNIMITKSGAKLLDFGLAAARAPESASAETAQHPLTSENHVVGTAMYMAPEVLRGSAADERSDVFALGLVLYEMLSGRRAFQAGDRASLIAEILQQQPPSPSDLVPGVPPALDRLVRACLVKDPDHRIQSAHDVKLQLQWIAENSVTGSPALKRAPSRQSAAVAAGAIALAAMGVIWWGLTRPDPTPQSSRVTRSIIDLRDAPPIALGKFAPPLGYFSPLLALSHNGTMVVYVGVNAGETQLFLRRLDSFTVEPIPETRGAHHAFFSPDDRWIGYFAGDRVLKVAVAGGSPIALAEVTQPIRGVWRHDGIYVIPALNVGLRRVPESGGTQEKLGDSGPFLSDVLPDGRHVLLRGSSKASGDFDTISILDLQTGARRTLIDRGYDARFVPPGYLTFVHSGDLHLVPFDLAKLEIAGEPVVVQRNVAMDSFWGQAQYSVSSAGALAFVPGGDRSVGKLTWVDRQGKTEELPLPARLYGVFSLSPDGKRLAVEVGGVSESIAIVDLERGETKPLRVEGDARRPEWTSDGRLLLSLLPSAGERRRIVSTDTAGEQVRIILQDPNIGYVHIANSLDGTHVLVHLVRPGKPLTAHLIPLKSPSKTVTLEGAGTASISPDGRWIAYVTRGLGREIMVAPIDEPLRARQVSIEGGGEPLWCRECPELFYRNGSRFYAARIIDWKTLQWDPPRLVWETEFVDTQGRSFDVSNDGSRLLISKHADPEITDRIHLIESWPELLRAKAEAPSAPGT